MFLQQGREARKHIVGSIYHLTGSAITQTCPCKFKPAVNVIGARSLMSPQESKEKNNTACFWLRFCMGRCSRSSGGCWRSVVALEHDGQHQKSKNNENLLVSGLTLRDTCRVSSPMTRGAVVCPHVASKGSWLHPPCFQR